MLFSSYYYLSFMHCVFCVQSYADAAFAVRTYRATFTFFLLEKSYLHEYKLGLFRHHLKIYIT